MSEGGADQISTRINQKLDGLSETSCKQFIFKIHEGLRKTNEMAYEPEILSIGPYHRGKKKLQKMEKYKLKYLKGMLRRQHESGAQIYIEALMQYADKAQGCYADDVSSNTNDFVEMMLLDGCFIIEFLRKYEKKEEWEDDPIFKMPWILDGLRRDLLLFENQVPFFILVKLFEMTKIPNQEKDLISLAISCLNDCIPVDTPIDESHATSNQPENVFHLLSLMYVIWCSSFAEAIEKEEKEDHLQKKKEFSSVTLEKVSSKPEQEEDQMGIVFIKSVTELKEHWIKFVKFKDSKSWLDIKFGNREMKIPPLIIDDDTESVLRNLIACEQYKFRLGYSRKFITDYTTLMDRLISTAEDVQKLRHQGIIEDWLGSDEKITKMFNNIGEKVMVCPREFSYKKLFENVNKHCRKRRNSWIANLKSTYFKNPWSIISFVAATFLLLLTLIQTLVSILPQIGL